MLKSLRGYFIDIAGQRIDRTVGAAIFDRMLSMRLEKNFPTWFRELRPIYGPFEGGMDRFIKMEKNDFVGRDAAAKELADGPKLRRVSMIVDAADADVMGDEPIWAKVGGKDFGTVGKTHDFHVTTALGITLAEILLGRTFGARGLAGFEIEHALNQPAHADRPDHRAHIERQLIGDFIQQGECVAALAIHFVNKGDDRNRA